MILFYLKMNNNIYIQFHLVFLYQEIDNNYIYFDLIQYFLSLN